eukprot:Hpha_TRINITY_DN15143_c2_g2::TRINITY_DN15143_c2_g2_i1::g.127498::m.127498
MGALSHAVWALTLFAVADAVSLRLLIHLFPRIESRDGRRRCSDTRSSDCEGGSAVLAAHLRQLASEAEASLRVVGLDDGRITLFHPDLFAINNANWRMLNTDVPIIGNPSLQTLFNTRRDDILNFLDTAPARPLISNFQYTGDGAVLEFLPLLERSVIVSAGRWRVGMMLLMGPEVFVDIIPLGEVIPAFVGYLRRKGCDLIVVICSGRPVYWLQEDWKQFNRFDIDVVVPPACEDRDCDYDAPLTYANGTWTLPPRDSATRSTLGEYVEVVDFSLMDSGKLQPTDARSVEVTSLPEELRDTPEYERDRQWLQETLDAATRNNPPIGWSNSPMPHGRVFNDQGEEVDEVCRRDQCPLGRFANEAVRRLHPDVDVVVINGGSCRIGWDAGNVTGADVYGAYPFEGAMCAFNTTGPEVWRILSKYMAKVAADGAYNDSAPNRGGFPQVEGLRVEFDPSRPQGENLLRLDVRDRHTGRWEPVRRTRSYRMLLPQFLCGGGDGYDFIKLKGTEQTFQINLQGYVFAHFYSSRTVDPADMPSSVFVNDPRPSFLLPRLYPSDCGPQEYYDVQWEACTPCPLDLVSDPVDRTRCIAPAVGEEGTTWIWVLVVSGFVFLIGAMIVVWRHTKNWRRIKRLHSANVMALKCAESIAAMDFESVEYITLIEKPNNLQKAFAAIIRILLEYRTFLPPAILVSEEDSLDIDQELCCLATSTGTGDPETPVKPPPSNAFPSRRLSKKASTFRQRRGSNFSRATSIADAESVISGTPGVFDEAITRHRAKENALASKEFSSKRISVLWCGMRGYHAVMDQDEAGAVSLTTFILEAIGGVLDEHGGLIDHLSGDRAVGTFGASRLCTNREARAADGALSLKKAVPPQVRDITHCGFDAGRARVGTVGSTMRRHSIYGQAMNVAFACTRVATRRLVDAVASEQIFNAINDKYAFRAVEAHYSMKHHGSGVMLLYELLCQRERLDNQEWMYQFQILQDKDEFLAFNKEVKQKAAASAEEYRARDSESEPGPKEQDNLLQRLDGGLAREIPFAVAF